MNKSYFYGAILVIGSVALSGTAMAKDHDKDRDRHHESREIREHRDHERHEAHESREARERRLHERHEHERQWARQHEHHDNGKHAGWEEGKHNPHHDAAFHPPQRPGVNSRPAPRPVPTRYSHRPGRPPAHKEPASQGK